MATPISTLKAEAFDHLELDPNKGIDSPGDELEWTEQEETNIRRKIDRHIVPLVTLLYLLCFLDRANVGNARIQGMAKDLHLVGYRFNWALCVFYIVYIIVEVPSNILLKHIGPRFYIPALVAGFGFVTMCTAFVKNFTGLCVARAFLGVFEGGTMPGIGKWNRTAPWP
jgi:sugar phosphate permease